MGSSNSKTKGEGRIMIRAVICDDEQAAIKIIRYFVENTNLPIEIVGTAENGRDALNLIKDTKPDIAFMDINMPFLDGFEVIEQIENTKVIVITAYDSFAYAQKALRMGVSDIILKPIDKEQMIEAIERTIGWKFTDNETLNRALEYLHTHYMKNISVEDIANAAYCSTSYISRLFKKHLQMSILDYLHKVRIKEAIYCLKTRQMGIQETAEYVGYQNLNNFYKYFKQETGETPAGYVQK